jgi:hypothetical protein
MERLVVLRGLSRSVLRVRSPVRQVRARRLPRRLRSLARGVGVADLVQKGTPVPMTAQTIVALTKPPRFVWQLGRLVQHLLRLLLRLIVPSVILAPGPAVPLAFGLRAKAILAAGREGAVVKSIKTGLRLPACWDPSLVQEVEVEVDPDRGLREARLQPSLRFPDCHPVLRAILARLWRIRPQLERVSGQSFVIIFLTHPCVVGFANMLRIWGPIQRCMIYSRPSCSAQHPRLRLRFRPPLRGVPSGPCAKTNWGMWV